MDTRPNVSTTLTTGRPIVYNAYITGGEKRAITEIYLESVDTKRDAPMGEPRAMFRAENKSIELVVVSLDGSAENIVQRILDLPTEETEEILLIVKEVIDPKKK